MDVVAALLAEILRPRQQTHLPTPSRGSLEAKGSDGGEGAFARCFALRGDRSCLGPNLGRRFARRALRRAAGERAGPDPEPKIWPTSCVDDISAGF
jgi:hypothetical protein